jgi:PTH1 family peptidyl-tRNA hydrolase
MKIIFAQGNPGKEYTNTRHNVGFLFIDALAASHRIEFVKKSKFHADIAESTIHGEKVLFVKPTTFYNETGQSARLLIDFYKCDPVHDFLVIHDDLALPLGTVRTRRSGSDAGNNGIKSLNAHLGPQYTRIRVGIYSDLRDRIPDADFVLGRFNVNEKDELRAVLELVERFVDGFIKNNFELTKVTISLEDGNKTETNPA